MLALEHLQGTLARHTSWKNACILSAALYFLYGVLLGIYRLTLHPLARFPGPKLAAATFAYEFYYDLFPHKLQYLWKIEQLHKKYGPIVRINPIHLHINDPEYLDEIYAAGRRKRNRDPWYYRSESNGPLGWSVFQTVEHDVHRMRRAALNPFFSTKSIQELESMIVDKIQELCGRFATACETGEVVPLTYACGALTMDVISAYAFGRNTDNIANPAYSAEDLEAYSKLSQFGPFGRQFPWVAKACLTLVPPSLMSRISPAAALIPKNRAIFRGLIQDAMIEQENSNKRDVDSAIEPTPKKQNAKTIFHDILQSKLPASEKATPRLAAEANLLVIAGTETTARTLSVVLFHIIDNSPVLQALRKEVAPLLTQYGMASPVSTISSLPYFSAVITEGIRLSHVVSSRMPRYAPEEDLQYGNWNIPAGTCIMQSHYLHHMNTTIFPDPYKFKPDRWLNNPELKQRYFMGFGRGSRICLGINLVYAELYLTIAHIVTRFDMQLHETVRERDVDVKRDCIIGLPSTESRGIRVQITRDRGACKIA